MKKVWLKVKQFLKARKYRIAVFLCMMLAFIAGMSAFQVLMVISILAVAYAIGLVVVVIAD